MQTLRDVHQRLTEEKINLTGGTLQQYRISLTQFERVHGHVPLAELTPLHIVGVMRHLRARERSERTCNNARKNLLTLWRAGEDMGFRMAPCPHSRRVPRMREPVPLPRAWTPEQMSRIVGACEDSPTERDWTGQHWAALVLTIYDTSLRIGCLLQSKADSLNMDDCTLTIAGRLQKGRRETCQPLHPDTASRLANLPRDNRLFPWPFDRREIWRKFRVILQSAGLPATRRDQFHRIRRTSYTMVAVAFGKDAAGEHAAHRGDLSRYYLDPTFLDKPQPIKALPRPCTPSH